MKKITFILAVALSVVLTFTVISTRLTTGDISISSLIHQAYAGDEEAYVYEPFWQDVLCPDRWGNGVMCAAITHCYSGSERCWIQYPCCYGI